MQTKAKQWNITGVYISSQSSLWKNFYCRTSYNN